ncbi:glycosyl hydrolase family 28-related protein [Paenibacillus sp. XY044]|uniref:glycosyl hydrolase family 28-related protein n=1 Tax=Paenibacillus sp. XY044 TaxID=2026089 RepID=UPI000B981488|nr:glycosyl hydrolase family 28-related protein [Paenibacillus sp. XY044]OZB98014.1 hypothetical protein CJP46_02285 [Paenibacillus sp. XY044]
MKENKLFSNELRDSFKILTVKDFGAKGNGVTDDFNSIKNAIARLKQNGGGILYFPEGKYRIGRGSDRTRDYGGITLLDISNIKILFDPAAVLWMDNLNPTTNLGDQCNGIVVKGNCNNITFENVAVEWAVRPVNRSTGDAFYFWGGIDAEQCPRNINLVNCRVKNAPQAGVIFQGCRDIVVENLILEHTHADGLHFNACHRNILVDGVRGTDVGDDCVALVTYYDLTNPANPYVYNNGRPPFNSPDMTTRNNNHSIIRNIIVDGDDHANGVRVSGGYDITVENVDARNRKTAVIVDSAIADGTTIKWSYLASRKIRIRNVRGKNNNVGFQVQYFNFMDASDWPTKDDFTLFDVTAENIDVDDNSLYGVYLERCRGVKFLGKVRSNNEIRFRNVKNISAEKIHADGSLFNLIGNSLGYPYPISSNIPDHDIYIEELKINGGQNFYAEQIGGVTIEKLSIRNSDKRAFVTSSTIDITVNQLSIYYPNRSNSSDFNKNAINVIKGWRTNIANLYVKTDSNSFGVDIGGGDSSEITNGFVIVGGSIYSTRNDSSPGIVFQGGTYGVTNAYANISYLNASEVSPRWKPYSRVLSARGSTSERPSGGTTAVSVGFEYFNETEGRPTWHKGSDVWDGANPPITSITNTPLYKGQIAIVGGIIYMAVGTTASTDWKQISN